MRLFPVISLAVVVAGSLSVTTAHGQAASIEGPRTSTHIRPAWLSEGLVIAGDWATWMARKQQIGASWTQDGYKLSDAEAEAAYRREMSDEMVQRLKRMGVTLVIMPLWSGMGSYEQERPGMTDAVRFAERVHAAGLRVGVYIHNGNLSRGFLAARPEAWEWLSWPSPEGNYKDPPPPETASEGYPAYRNHPGYQQFARGLIEYAVKEVKADLLHFDNYVYTSGYGPQAIDDFRGYLRTQVHRGAVERALRRAGDGRSRPAGPFWQHFPPSTSGSTSRPGSWPSRIASSRITPAPCERTWPAR